MAKCAGSPFERQGRCAQQAGSVVTAPPIRQKPISDPGHRHAQPGWPGYLMPLRCGPCPAAPKCGLSRSLIGSRPLHAHHFSAGQTVIRTGLADRQADPDQGLDSFTIMICKQRGENDAPMQSHRDDDEKSPRPWHRDQRVANHGHRANFNYPV